MCEIYGFSGNRSRELNNDLREFYSHSAEHPNGWGLALFNEQKSELLSVFLILYRNRSARSRSI